MSGWRKVLPIPAVVLFITIALFQAPSIASDTATLDWDDLVPPIDIGRMKQDEQDLQALLDEMHAVMPEQRLSEATPYSEIETIAGFTQRIDGYSAVQALDGRKVRIPGFVVALEFPKPGRMGDFQLVPYFGACVHVPPPPPNQIVFVDTDRPLDMKDIWGAVWVTGILRTARAETDYAQALYTLELDRIELYEEEW